MAQYSVTNPATGRPGARYPNASDAEIRAVLDRAHAAYRTWSRETTRAERVAMTERAAQLHRERAEELATSIHTEMGKPLAQAHGGVASAAAKIEAFVRGAPTRLADEELHVADGLRTMVRKQPLGVILGVMPWNYPSSQVARFAAANLILGNTVIVKLPNQCPETAMALQRLYADAGFPDGAYSCVFATHPQIADIIADDRVQGVSVTGSEQAGQVIAEQAGRHLKKCVLELGGSDPFIVLDTDDLDYAVAQVVAGRMENTGQACNGSKRIIVLEKYYEEFSAKFAEAMAALSYALGDYGPLASAQATGDIVGLVQNALDQGAELVVGDNEPDGNIYTPGVLAGITPAMEVFSQELFGPVAQLYRVADDEEAIALANSSPYGLGSVVICDDTERAMRVGDRLEVGMVFIGAAGLEAGDVPFGGVKRSGYGRELGRFGIEEFANRKIFRIADGR